jgi:hypothetical protein
MYGKEKNINKEEIKKKKALPPLRAFFLTPEQPTEGGVYRNGLNIHHAFIIYNSL